MRSNVIMVALAAVLVLSTFAFASGTHPSPSAASSAAQATPVASAYNGNVMIYANGSVSASGVFQVSGSSYTLLQDVNGTVTDLMNGSSINGNGHMVNALGSTGIDLSGVTGVYVSNIVVYDGYYSLYFYDSNHSTAENVSVQSATEYGFFLSNSDNITISDSLVNDSFVGVYAEYSGGLFMGNVLSTNQMSYFLYAYDCSGMTVTRCNTTIIYSYEEAIYLDYCNAVQISHNTIFNASDGIGLQECSNVHSSYNIVSNQLYSGYGFSISYSANIYSSHDSAFQFYGYGMYLYYSSNVNIQYGNFMNTTYGSYLYQSDNVSISGTDFSNVTAYYGQELYIESCGIVNLSRDNFNQSLLDYSASIYLDIQVSPVIITNASIYNIYGDGIDLTDAFGLYLNYSTIIAQYGVYTYSTTSSLVFSNDLFEVAGGVAVELSGPLSSGTSVSNCVFEPFNSITYSYGVLIEPSVATNSIVVNNSFYNLYYPIELYPVAGQQAIISGNVITNPYYGIEVEHVSGASITDNTITGATDYGFYLNFLSGVNASGNSISLGPTYYADGIYASDLSSSSLVSDNVITGSAYYYSTGVYFYYSTSLTVSGNLVTNCYYGLDSVSNSEYTYFNNSVLNSGYSLYLQGDSNGTVYGNTFSGASVYIVYVYSVADILIYHNNFIQSGGNTIAIYTSIGLSFNLSKPIGGNYWSGYTGVGVNGLGLTPYNLTSGYADYLPLTSRWYSTTVTFIESGLPSGTTWSVNVAGKVLTSSRPAITYQPDNAMYVSEAYSLGSVAGYVAGSGSGTLSLDGTNQTVYVTFSPYKYSLTFAESGLSSGTSWSVTLNGTTKTSTSSTIVFSEPNGSYTYRISNVAGYGISSGTGFLSVSGNATTVAAAFSKYSFVMTFEETGLPSGSSWTVTINGVNHSATGSQFQLSLPSGSYTVGISGPSGYSTSFQTQNVSLDNGNTTFVVQFASSQQSPTGQTPGSTGGSLGLPSGTSGYEYIGLGIILGAVVGVVIGLAARRGKSRGGNKGGQS